MSSSKYNLEAEMESDNPAYTPGLGYRDVTIGVM